MLAQIVEQNHKSCCGLCQFSLFDLSLIGIPCFGLQRECDCKWELFTRVGGCLWIHSLTNCSIQFKCNPLSFNNTITLINACSLEIWQNFHHRQPHQIRPCPRYTPISRPLLGSSFQSFTGPTSNIISHLCFNTIEFSVNSGKHSTRTLSLVQNQVKFKKNLQTNTLAFNAGGGEGGALKLRRAPFLCAKLIFILFWHPPLSFFLSASTAAPTCTTTIITYLQPCALNV